MSGSQGHRPPSNAHAAANHQRSTAQEAPDLQEGVHSGNAMSLHGLLGNAGVSELLRWMSDSRSGGSAPADEGSLLEEAAEVAAVEAPAPVGPRRVEGGGNYVYEQDPDGTIRIVSGPSGVGLEFGPGSRQNTAITREIGEFPAVGPAVGTAPSEEAATEPAAPETAPEAASDAGEEGWLAWLASSAMKLEETRRSLEPGRWLGERASEAAAWWWSTADEKKAPEELEAPTEEVTARAPESEAPARRRPTVEAVTRNGDAPEASQVVEGTDAIEVNSLVAAEGYLPQYDEEGKLVSGVGKYGFGQGRLVRDASARQWEDGETEGARLTELWCSGLSSGVLSDLGYDLDGPIPDRFYWENGQQKAITMRMVIEGMPEIMAQSEEADTFARQARDELRETLEPEYEAARALPEGTAAEKRAKDTAIRALDSQVLTFYNQTLYGLEGNFGEAASEDSLLVKGAAGAFELAGIGRELSDLKQARPGDFCQSRNVDSPIGHAYQIHSVVASGSIIAGLGGSPEILGEAPEVEPGTTVEGVRFRIDQRTNPNTVLASQAESWSVIESNTRGALSGAVDPRTGERADREGDGGVAVRQDANLPKTPDGAKRLYVGRLAASPWYAFLNAETA